MRKKIKRPWPFTKKEASISSLKPTGPEDLPLSGTFRDITELPLSRWIEFTVDGNRKALIKEGNPSDAELFEAEQRLKLQYADAIGDYEYKHYCRKIAEVTRDEMTLEQIRLLVKNLSEVYVPYFAEQVNKLLSYKFAFDVNNPEQYEKDLKGAIQRSKAIKINIDLQNIAIKKMQEKYSQGGSASREYFAGMLITLRQDAGYHILAEEITVWEFCEMIRRYNKSIETLKTKPGGRKGN